MGIKGYFSRIIYKHSLFINFNGGAIVEIFAKAKDLADALAASAELAALKEAEMRMRRIKD